MRPRPWHPSRFFQRASPRPQEQAQHEERLRRARALLSSNPSAAAGQEGPTRDGGGLLSPTHPPRRAHTMEAASPIGAPLRRRRLSSHLSLSRCGSSSPLIWRLRGDPAAWRLRSSVLRARLGCKSKERLDRAPPALLRRLSAACSRCGKLSCTRCAIRKPARSGRRDARARVQGQGCSAETGQEPALGRRLGLFSVQHAAVAAPACRVVLPRWRRAARCESRKVRQRGKSSAAGWLTRVAGEMPHGALAEACG